MCSRNEVLPGMRDEEILDDFGPVYAFWCFSFERYNGILGSQPNNNRSIEPQLMSRFLRDNFVYSFNFPTQFCEDFSPVSGTS